MSPSKQTHWRKKNNKRGSEDLGWTLLGCSKSCVALSVGGVFCGYFFLHREESFVFKIKVEKMALQCITIVWAKTHQNCQRDRWGQWIFSVCFRKERSTCWLHCQGHSKQCHLAVVAVRWKVLAVPELAWKRTGSRSVLFPPFAWICRHNHLGRRSLMMFGKVIWVQISLCGCACQSDRMRLGNCHGCRQGRGCGSQSEVSLVTQLCCSQGGVQCTAALSQHCKVTGNSLGSLNRARLAAVFRDPGL